MTDELEICAAAFVRIKGKEVFTESEFKMEVNLNLKWVSAKEADLLIKALVSRNIFSKNNGFIKVAKDLSSVQVPIAYHPTDALKKSLSGTMKNDDPAPASDAPRDMFIELMDMAVENGIQKGKFVSECNILKKKLNVDTSVAALILLRDWGVNIEKVKDLAYTQILEK